MRIALAQINPIVGNIDYNFNKIITFIEKAKSLQADLVIFPENATIGYPAKDLLDRRQLILENIESINKLCSHSKDIAIICGFVDINPLSSGKRLHNSAVFIQDGQINSIHHKSLLPEYDVFEERRYFEPAHCVHTINFKDKKIGITICEDLWVYSDEFSKTYKYNPCKILKEYGAEILINISASPYSYDKPAVRLQTIKNAAIKTQCPVIYVNQVGGNDELIFDGMSLVADQKGEIKAIANNFSEDLIIYDTNNNEGDKHNTYDNEIECIYNALTLGLKDYVIKCGFKKVVMGLSGGIDSALTAAIATKAIGKDNIVGILMPGPYSSEGSITDALQLVNNLGIKHHIYPINSMFKAALETIQPDKDIPTIDLAEENLQARLRGNIVMTMSNRYGYLTLTTGNKSELSVGYATLYGDMCGGLAVISDLYKTQVYELSRFINQVENGIIPSNSINKPPSAELRPDQKDQDSLPPYDILDKILYDYIELGFSYIDLLKKYDKDTVKFVLNKVDKSEYKRRQAAPGLKISSKAFGTGRRLPIATQYKWK